MGIWTNITNSMIAGHTLPRANLSDQFLYEGENTLLSRAAWIPGMGIGVKSASILPSNPEVNNLPTIHGSMVVFDDATGQVRGTLDSAEITNLKTAADSVLGAKLLARPSATSLLIIGAGFVAEQLAKAYAELMPHLSQVRLWNRTAERGAALVQKLGAEGYAVTQVSDLETAVTEAHVISSAVMVQEPILRGDLVQPGTHVDLIGAFTPHMREGDDTLLQKARLFCDCLDTTVEHIGEFMDPIARGVIAKEQILGDFYDLIPGTIGREGVEEITLFKNGGGAHLDLMTAQILLNKET